MTELEMGPIDYLALEIPAARMRGAGLAALLDLTEQGTIRVLDLVVARVAEDGGVTVLELADLDGDGELDLTVFEGARSGLLGDDDIAAGAALVEPGSAVALLVYENTWAGPFVTAMREVGAEVIAGGRIPAQDLAAALDDLEATEA
ncbi:DUF6325 family protein [Nocardioides sambongensis]|uniref:DUF6325 family protein n=1 Tax=Nocardioides sambongensis TaxID=2589074 RepID=UPI0015E8389B|nr:DUF6325 family protein [Nocardioides sambongensis]